MDGQAEAFRDPGVALDERVADLLSRLSTGEKVAMLHQNQPPVPRLGLLGFRTGTEALHGVAWLGAATVFPQAVGLASTWNLDLVRAVGEATGAEARGFHHRDPEGSGLNVWAPVVNPLRDPRWGRNEEGYSEDPLLTSAMGTAYAGGLRGDHPVYLRTAPTLKHFLAYNNETDRCTTSSNLRARVLHEYELPCFRGPVESGAAVAVMPSYNLVNGRPAHLSTYLDAELRTWTDDEVVAVSDAMAPSNIAGTQAYYATHVEGYAAALRAGLDSFTDHDQDVVAAITEALRLGMIGEDDVDRAVGRVLALRMRLGEFDPPEANPYAAITDEAINLPAHQELALEAARQSIVLLKNDGGALPLDPVRQGTIAVVGTHAGTLFEDWYSGTLPYQVTPFEGVLGAYGGVTTFAEGLDRVVVSAPDGRFLTASAHRAAGWTRFEVGGVRGPAIGQLFDLADWGQGAVTLRSVVTDRYLAASEDGELVVDRTMPGGWHVRELFELRPTGEGTYLLHNTVLGRCARLSGETVDFLEDEEHATPFRVDVVRSGIAEAVARAAAADAAIVVVGNDPHINGRETQDRVDLELPPWQSELIKAVSGVNPNTVVVVVSSYPYALVWEDEHVPAILWTSHGGQELGHALAEVLFGRTTPSGRLTQTWYRSADELPGLLDYDIIRAGSTYLYFEGDPLYPFGHGLSYTTFDYDELELGSTTVDATDELLVSVRVTNTGDRAGADVVQLYSRQRESRARQPVRQLRAFERVELEPGERRTVRFVVRGEDLWHWDVTSGRRVVETAPHDLLVGPLSAGVAVVGESVPPRRLSTLRAEDFDDYAHVALADEARVAGTVVESAGSGAWLLFGGVALDDAITSCALRVAGDGSGHVRVELRLDDPTAGELVGAVDVRLGGDRYDWRQASTAITWTAGTRDLYVVFGEPGVRLAEMIFSVS